MPLNPALAEDVLGHLIEKMAPCAAILDAEFRGRSEKMLRAANLPIAAVIPIGAEAPTDQPSFAAFVDQASSTEPDVIIHGDDIWELLFASGTTAMPKGVMISHSASHLAGLTYTASLTRGLPFESDLRVAVFLPMTYHIGDQAFTLSVWLAGGTLVLGRKPVPRDIAASIEVEAVTALLGGSPPMLEALADELDHKQRVVTSLGVIAYSWGSVAPTVYERLRRHTGDNLLLIGVLAQTESIAGHRFSPTAWPEVYARTAPDLNYVGLPNPLLASDIVNESGESVLHQPGVAGEAVYRSPIVTAGYYLDEEAIRTAFRGGWFHSGDSVMSDELGLRIMVDRFKDIVRSGGENVSSIRVEAVLQGHAAVARAAVIGLPHSQWGEAVTAVVLLRPGHTATDHELIAHCRSRLAGFETPKAVVFADDLPQTVGGKVLKYKLRKEYADTFSAAN